MRVHPAAPTRQDTMLAAVDPDAEEAAAFDRGYGAFKLNRGFLHATTIAPPRSLVHKPPMTALYPHRHDRTPDFPAALEHARDGALPGKEAAMLCEVWASIWKCARAERRRPPGRRGDDRPGLRVVGA